MGFLHSLKNDLSKIGCYSNIKVNKYLLYIINILKKVIQAQAHRGKNPQRSPLSPV